MGRPRGSTKAAMSERYNRILQIAHEATNKTSQTLRHIYYRVSGQGIVPKDDAGYGIVADAIKKARWNRDLVWTRIIDGSREVIKPVYWNDSQAFLEAAVPQFKINMWKGQRFFPVIVCEKDAIVASLAPVCEEYGVPLIPCRGHESDSMVYEIAQYLVRLQKEGGHEAFVVYYLGDFDPQGLEIDETLFGSEDNYSSDSKLTKMLNEHVEGGERVTFVYERLGITREQLRDPANAAYVQPAKEAHSLAGRTIRENFIERTGSDDTLGIDALSHEDIEELVRRAIEGCRDRQKWNRRERVFKKQQKGLAKLTAQ